MALDELIARCQRGDAAAVAELVSQYATFVYRVGLMVLRQAEDAEDAMQETLVKAVRALPDYSHKDEASFRAWLHRIALNTAISRTRRAQLPQVAWEALDSAPVPEPGPEDQALKRLDQSDVLAAVDRLSEGQRLVIILRYYNDLSCEEIADLLQVPLGTVGSRLFNARQRLRELLTDERHEGSQTACGVSSSRRSGPRPMTRLATG